MHLKFGLKLWSTNTQLIPQAVNLIDEKIFNYIELFVVPATQINPFIIDIPYIIHIPHDRYGIDINDSKKNPYSLQIINECEIWADRLNAQYLILHPGEGSLKNGADLLRDITDNRILIENMPRVGINNEDMTGYSPDQIKELIGENELGFCLDLHHAVKAAVSMKRDYKEIISDFLALQPKVFHISDGDSKTDKDYHQDIGSGSFDFAFFKKCIQNSGSKIITLETPRRNHLSFNDDIKNIRMLRTMWNS
jgi:deoxyribonuclease-4